METHVEYELVGRKNDALVVRITTTLKKRVKTTEYVVTACGLSCEAYAVRKLEEGEGYAAWHDLDRYLVLVDPHTAALSCDCKGYQGHKYRRQPTCKHCEVIGWLREEADLGPLREEALAALKLLKSPLAPEQVSGEVARALLTLREAMKGEAS